MKLFVATAFLIILSSAVLAQDRETRNVGEFNRIAFRLPGKLYLKQGSSRKVELEGDKDLLKEIETEVEGNRLVIGREGKWGDWSWGNDFDEVKVYITAPDIEGLSVAGSGDLIGQGLIKTGEMELAVSGSGSMKVEIEVTGDLEADVSGSGDLTVRGKARSVESNVSGSGDVEMEVTIAEGADLTVSGSGKILAKGSVDRMKIGISGSGKVLAADMQANRCDVRITGSGDVEIDVKNELDATIAGSGSVRYKGNPSKVNSNSAGSGSVRKM